MSLIVLNEKLFEDLYWNSKPHELRALRNAPSVAAAVALAMQGFVVDKQIMGLGWGAFNVMEERFLFGYTWIPSILMPPVMLAPGRTLPGYLAYDPNNPPPGSIKVSLDSADYPAFDLPVIVPVAPLPESPVGPQQTATVYLSLANHFPDLKLKNGDKWDTDPRGKFVFHKVPFLAEGIFQTWFEKTE